jgi:hypothetical protein
MGASGFLFNVNWFELSTAVPTPANLAWRVPGPNKLILSWPENLGWRLQSQTNSLTQGLGTNWLDLPGAGSPYTNSLDPSAPVVLYRLVHP